MRWKNNSAHHSKFSSFIKEKDNVEFFQMSGKRTNRTPKIYSERVHKKGERNNFHNLSKDEMFSIPYPLWTKRKFQAESSNEETLTQGGSKTCKPLILNKGKVTISQTVKELSKNNNRLEEKNSRLQLKNTELKNQNRSLKNGYQELNKTKIELNKRFDEIREMYDKTVKELKGSKLEVKKKVMKQEKEFQKRIDKMENEINLQIYNCKNSELRLKELQYEVSLGVTKDTGVSLEFIYKLLELRSEPNDRKVLEKLVKIAKEGSKTQLKKNKSSIFDQPPSIISISVAEPEKEGKINNIRKSPKKKASNLSTLLHTTRSWKSLRVTRPTKSFIKKMKKDSTENSSSLKSFCNKT
mmetsp:Transcript_517/g.455  ORF Transcript_517/g.455 Transcript_517/m.455 type:complete len:354 (+) Transcript_517:80-1141(+)